jgi:hypothetical protein
MYVCNVRTCMYVCMYECVCVYVCIMYVCVCVCMYVNSPVISKKMCALLSYVSRTKQLQFPYTAVTGWAF